MCSATCQTVQEKNDWTSSLTVFRTYGGMNYSKYNCSKWYFKVGNILELPAFLMSFAVTSVRILRYHVNSVSSYTFN